MLALVLLFIKDNNFVLFEKYQTHISKGMLALITFFLIIILTGSDYSGNWFYLRQLLALFLYPIITYHLFRNLDKLSTIRLQIPKFSSILVPFLIMLNGITPILGLKTSSAWQMYSNLNMSETTSNHYLIPPSLDLAGYLKDRVTIISSSNLDTGLEMPYLLLLRYCNQNKCHNLYYSRNNQIVHTNGEKEQIEFRSLSIIEKKLINFNAFNTTGKDCRW